MDLFDHHGQRLAEQEAPLAARMRPRTLADYIGQEHLIGPGRLLRRAIQADQLASLIFYGPPGTGKTTLARVIANTTKAQFLALNAVLSGVKDIREAIDTAQAQRGQFSRRTILFVDEVHRFNKAQQDALLPWVENGTVVLIGATTENPYFEVNKALVSRSRIFQLKPLTAVDLRRIVQQTLADSERGYGGRAVVLAPAAVEHWVNVANGDARALLNALELAVETTEPDPDGTVQISLTVAEDSIQQRAVLYDKEGDAHFDTISAFIKSVRGSDGDAALYWLARMVYAGENPRFIFRRLVILASEDVGLADPQAVGVVTACAAAFDRIGMPEGRYPLAQATLYLATAPKSNSVMGFFDALAAVEQQQQADVPNPMRDNSRDQASLGHGAGYLYPHAYQDHWVAQQYLPTGLQGQVFYQPSTQGYEQEIRGQVARRREAQLAAMVEGGEAMAEGLTYGPVDSAQERWLQRTLGQAGGELAALRDRIFAQLQPQRHHRLLDLNAGSGLLTWEAVRRVPEGGVFARVGRPEELATLTQQAAALPALNRPVVFAADLAALAEKLAVVAPGVRFDGMVGRNGLGNVADRGAVIQGLKACLVPGGRLVLAEVIPQHSQRLYRLLPPGSLAAALQERLAAAEERLYRDPADPQMGWDGPDLAAMFEGAGFAVDWRCDRSASDLYLSPQLIQRWWQRGAAHRSYCDRIAPHLSAQELDQVKQAFQRLTHQTCTWQRSLFVGTMVRLA